MTVTGWKALAGVIAVAIGGLVVWADECPVGQGTPCPKPAPTANGFALPTLAETTPAICPCPAKTASYSMPDAQPTPKTDPDPVPPAPLAVAVPAVVTPPAPPMPAPAVGYAEPVPPPPTVAAPPPPTYAAPVSYVPPTPPTPPLPSQPVPVGEPDVEPCQLHVCIGSGRPRIELRCDDLMLLKVTCDRVDLQSSETEVGKLAGVQASGHVHVHGYGIDGDCEQLLINSMDGRVTLKGGVTVQFRKGRQSTDVVAEQMSFVVSPSGLSQSGVSVGLTPTRR